MDRPFFSVNRPAAARITIGFVQGIALYWLSITGAEKIWPGQPEAWSALNAVAIFVPLVAIVGLGNLRPRTLLIWSMASALISAAVGYHAVSVASSYGPAVWGSAWNVWGILSSTLTCLIFIGNALVTAGDADRKPIADFPTYFEVSWKQVTQLSLAVVFTGLFWCVLWLGAWLFRSIEVRIVADTISERWFWVPATTVAVSVALHLTDAQAGLVSGARTLLLNLLSWLMPILTLIGAAFLVALFFTGLDPLWRTRWGTTSLMIAAALLILLINSHFQDGRARNAARILLYARFVAALMVAPLVVLAAVGLGMRVDQYGWTPSRVTACAYLVMLAAHALGYAFAALSSGPALRGLPTTNVVSAFFVAAGLFALLTPIADPSRISVADQVGRLESGRIAPDKFDFAFLEHHSGLYGKKAYERLRTNPQGPNAARITARIEELRVKSGRPANEGATAETRLRNITVVRPAGGALPADFANQEWKRDVQASILIPRCLAVADATCEASLIDLTDDNEPEIVIYDPAMTVVFARAADGTWKAVGQIRDRLSCFGVREALRTGKIEPAAARFKDIEAAGETLQVLTPHCPTRVR